VAQVWAKFQSDGAEAAFAFGLTLDLKVGTLKEWMRFMAKDMGQEVPATIRKAKAPAGSTAAKEGKPAKLPKLSKAERAAYIPAANGKRRIFAAYYPERFGTLVHEGPETSQIRWDNGETADQYLPNRFVVDVKKVNGKEVVVGSSEQYIKDVQSRASKEKGKANAVGSTKGTGTRAVARG